MQIYFLHNVYVPDENGNMVVSHPDCDAVPVMRVYSSAGSLIETPTGIQNSTLYSPSGHYAYTLTWTKYINDAVYYWIIDWLYEGSLGRSQRQYFKWGFAGTSTGVVNDGYNLNLLAALKVTFENDPTLVSLLNHNPLIAKRDKLHRKSVFKKPDMLPDDPIMTFDIVHQALPDNVDMDMSYIRRNVLECKFHHKDDQQLLFKLLDRLIAYMTAENTFQGVRIKSTDNVFWSFNTVNYDQTLIGPESILPWNEELKRYESGVRFVFTAGLNIHAI